jgi:predicted metalloprotease with PDZ domain
MNSRLAKIASFVLLVSVAAAVAADEKDHRCNATPRVCEQEIRRMLGGRRYLGAQVMELNPGLLIKGVVEDSPAERADLRAGDRIMAVNGRSTAEATIREFKQILGAASDTGKLFMIVQRRGALKQLSVRLEAYPEAQIEQIIAQHLVQNHAQTANANANNP